MNPNTPLTQQTTYTISKQNFIVTPVFGDNKPNTLGQVLLRLMQAEMDNAKMPLPKK